MVVCKLVVALGLKLGVVLLPVFAVLQLAPVHVVVYTCRCWLVCEGEEKSIVPSPGFESGSRA